MSRIADESEQDVFSEARTDEGRLAALLRGGSAPAVIPHVAGKAMVMKRYPNGVSGDFFS